MIELLRELDWNSLNWASILLRVGLSVLIGGILGLERGIKRHPAGFRTYILVCLGSAMVMMTNQFIVENYGGSDPARLGAQVISGIGFLGAGTIIVTSRNQVRGLTTAASLWISACLGVAIGIGFYEGAVIGGVIVLIIMTVFQGFDDWVASSHRYLKIYVTFDSIASFENFTDYCAKMDIKVNNIELGKSKVPQEEGVVAIMQLENPKRVPHGETIEKLHQLEGVRHIEEF